MPVFQLTEDLVFPPIHLAEPEGLLAVGGDLSMERLILAYGSGIFPWYSEGEPLLWWSPDPRLVLFPDRLKVSNSMRRILKSRQFHVTFDQDFRSVITHCQTTKRKDQDDTWITDDMLNAYMELHDTGYAHSVEVWSKTSLVGGLYGISLGKAFFGESMFTQVPNASKVGFIHLVRHVKSLDFQLIDCQIPTNHLKSLGAVEISRDDFKEKLEETNKAPTITGNWEQPLPHSEDNV